jgi:hypothetical protein
MLLFRTNTSFCPTPTLLVAGIAFRIVGTRLAGRVLVLLPTGLFLRALFVFVGSFAWFAHGVLPNSHGYSIDPDSFALNEVTNLPPMALLLQMAAQQRHVFHIGPEHHVEEIPS